MISAHESSGGLGEPVRRVCVIEPVKLREYLLSLDHPDGRAKAR